MLLRLQPSQVSAYWQDIKRVVSNSCPPLGVPTEQGLNRLLEMLVKEEMHAWVLSVDKVAKGLIVTNFMLDYALGTRNLFIYSCSGDSDSDETVWAAAFRTLAEFAVGQGCSKILGYSADGRVIEKVKSYGCKADTVLIEYSLEV